MDRPILERQLAAQLDPVARGWRQLADIALSGLGVSISTGWCLVWLDRLGEDVRQADLARAVGITEASLVRILHQLEASGQLVRQSNPDDRRVNHLLLTEQGKMLATSIEANLVDLRRALLADLPSEDIEASLRVLGRIADIIAQRRQS